MSQSNKKKSRRRRQVMIARACVAVGMVTLMVFLIVILVSLLKKETDHPGGAVDIEQTDVSEPESTVPSSDPEQIPSTEESESSEPEASTSEDTPTTSESGVSDIQQSTVEKVNGKWNLEELDNTPRNFGYSDANRAENMVPKDWAFYEKRWGQYAVDWIQDTSSNTIYLTMDVGFANDYTEGILDTLKEKNVKAVFFITKMFFDSSPDTIQRMINEGHIIGNHTCNHPDMPSLDTDKAEAEMMDLWNAMNEKFGYQMKLFRFPEGCFSDRTLALVENCGMKSVFWSYAYNDYSTKQPEVQPSYEKAVKYLHPGAIYLLHASSSTNAAFLGDWIDTAREKGYEFGVYPVE